MLELKITLAACALACIAVLSPNEQAQQIIAAIIGSGLGGYMGSLFFPGKAPGHVTLRKRWAANIAAGTCFGPGAATWLHPQLPEQPLLFVTLFSSGAIGAVGVLLLTIIIPPLFRWIQTKTPSSPPTNES